MNFACRFPETLTLYSKMVAGQSLKGNAATQRKGDGDEA